MGQLSEETLKQTQDEHYYPQYQDMTPAVSLPKSEK